MKNDMIISLDIPFLMPLLEAEERCSFVLDFLAEKSALVKINHGLIVLLGVEKIRRLCSALPIMLDLKFHDIPHTVIGAVGAYSKVFPQMRFYTFHGACDDRLIEAIAKDNTVIGVCVLVLSSSVIDEPKFLEMAYKSYGLGIRHFICPGAYLRAMRYHFGEDVVLFTPGIRDQASKAEDHAKSFTATEARKDGANYIIIGRPIMQSTNLEATWSLY